MTKTSMQLILEYLESVSIAYTHEMVMDKAKELLEKERDQIKEAYNYGYRDGINRNKRCESYSGSDNYYTYKYGGEE